MKAADNIMVSSSASTKTGRINGSGSAITGEERSGQQPSRPEDLMTIMMESLLETATGNKGFLLPSCSCSIVDDKGRGS
jgi:hypothetical protein